MNPQQGLDAPRIYINANDHGKSAMHGSTVLVEEGIDADVLRGLQDLGHKIEL